MNPPPGYRLLTEGEEIDVEDVYCKGPGHSWHKTLYPPGRIWSASTHWVYARKLPVPVPAPVTNDTFRE